MHFPAILNQVIKGYPMAGAASLILRNFKADMIVKIPVFYIIIYFDIQYTNKDPGCN